MNLGDAFLMPLEGQNVEHLFLVISDPAAHEEFIMVNVTTDAARAGHECPMFPAGGGRPADHQWITRESYVSFADAELVTKEKAEVLRGLLQRGRIRTRPRLRQEVLDRIVEAARKSKALPVGLKKYLPP